MRKSKRERERERERKRGTLKGTSKEQQGSYTENHVCLIIKAMQKG